VFSLQLFPGDLALGDQVTGRSSFAAAALVAFAYMYSEALEK